MTNQEAKRRLLNIERSLPNTFRTKEDVKNFEALEMGIKALEQESTPNDDYFRKMAGVVISQLRTDRDRLEDELAKREQEPCEKDWRFYYDHGYAQAKRDLSCEDAISKQAVLDLAKKGVLVSNGNYESVCKAINDLPSVKQEPKTGYWIEDTNGTYTDNHDTWECSECGNAQILLEGTPKDNDYNYCPNCGAKMVEPQESEVQE
jgi:DNA-directed RNA polymerase subunit RPC12/RpoP